MSLQRLQLQLMAMRTMQLLDWGVAVLPAGTRGAVGFANAASRTRRSTSTHLWQCSRSPQWHRSKRQVNNDSKRQAKATEKDVSVLLRVRSSGCWALQRVARRYKLTEVPRRSRKRRS